MLQELIEEASRWDLVPETACLWWTSTYDLEERCDTRIHITTGYHKFPFEEKFRILGCAYVPWKIKCRRLVDHVHAVIPFGSENWSWTIQTFERIKGWETKTMLRFCRFKRQKEETWVDYYARTCKTARKTWIQIGLSVRSDLQNVCGEPWNVFAMKDPMW